MNKSISKLHLDLLDKKRQELLSKLIPYARGFVLSGGTALAIQLAHRKSFDFDFFSSSQIPKKLRESLSKTIPIKNVVVDTLDELTFFTKDNIKVTFLYYPFKPYLTPIKLKTGLLIFPIKEIALQKAYTIGRRGEYRDYFDLYTIFKNSFIVLNELIPAAKKVYNSLFDEKLFLQQLVYFGDLSNFRIIPATKKVPPKPKEIKNYFENLVRMHL